LQQQCKLNGVGGSAEGDQEGIPGRFNFLAADELGQALADNLMMLIEEGGRSAITEALFECGGPTMSVKSNVTRPLRLACGQHLPRRGEGAGDRIRS